MATKNQILQFTITNNTTDCNIDVPFLAQDSPIINARKKYTWNITGLNLGCGCWSIVINNQTFQAYFDGTLPGLLTAFTNLGFSFFCSTTSGGSLFLYTLDDYNVYGDVDSCFCIPPPTTTTSTTTSTTTPAPTTTTSTTTSTTTPTPTTTTSTTTSTTTPPPTPTTTTSTTTSTTTPTPTTTSTTTSTTTPTPTTTSTTTSTTTPAPTTTTSTTTSTTTVIPAFATWTWTDNTNGGGSFEIFVNSILVVQQFGAGNTGLYSGSYAANVGDNVSVNVNSNGNPSGGTDAVLYIENPNGTIIFNSVNQTNLPNTPQSISYSFTQAATSVVNGFSNNV
jgi:hypothetical protein